MRNSIDQNKRFSLIACVFFIFFAVYHIIAYTKQLIYDVKPEDLIELEGIVKENLYVSTIGKSVTHSIGIKLKNRPSFNFNIYSVTLNQVNTRELISKVKANDTVQLSILLVEYQKKISKEKALNIFDRFNYKFINVYGLKKENTTYLTIDEYNKAENNNAIPMLCIFIFGFLALFYWLYRNYFRIVFGKKE